MTKPRAADDFASIRTRMEELRRERSQENDDWLQVGVTVKITNLRDGQIVSYSHVVTQNTLVEIKKSLASGTWKVEPVV